MNSSRPYLIRALYEWINDNYKTPYIVVDAEFPNVMVPKDYVEQGKIVLNISPEAIHALIMNNSEIEFDAKFSGKSRHIYIPIGAVSAIFAQENGAGMVFGSEPGGGDEGEGGESSGSSSADKKSHLKLVK